MLLSNRISKDRLPSWRWWISMSRRNHAAHYQSLRVVSGRTTIILKWLAISGYSTTFDAPVIMQLSVNIGRFFLVLHQNIRLWASLIFFHYSSINLYYFTLRNGGRHCVFFSFATNSHQKLIEKSSTVSVGRKYCGIVDPERDRVPRSDCF